VLDAEPRLGSEALRPHREEDPKARTPEGGAVDTWRIVDRVEHQRRVKLHLTQTLRILL
jgi:hypothetical protein